MKTAGIGIDKYKLDIFKKHLNGAGFEFTEFEGTTEDTLLLKVEFEEKDIRKLSEVVAEANFEATKSRLN